MSIERARGVVVLLGLVVAACGDDLPDPEQGGMSSSSSTTSTTGTSTSDGTSSTSTSAMPASSDEGGTTTTGPSTVGIPDECTVTTDCADGELCVAPFDQSAGPEGKGAYECVSECVAIMDEDRWCADAVACCDPLAECSDRGYCVYPDGSTGGSESSGSSDGSSGSSSSTG